LEQVLNDNKQLATFFFLGFLIIVQMYLWQTTCTNPNPDLMGRNEDMDWKSWEETLLV